MTDSAQTKNAITAHILVLACVVLLCAPGPALAEVSDKMPSVWRIIGVGSMGSVCVLLAGWYRWWLAWVCLPVLLVFVSEPITLWNDPHMREALLHEQGYAYFGALVCVCALLTLALIAGIVAGRHRKTTHEVDAP